MIDSLNMWYSLWQRVRTDKAITFSVVIYRCESWTIKKAECWRIDAFHLWCWKTVESPLDCKEIQPVNPKGNQSSILTGRTDAETPILWLPDEKSWSIGKDPDAGEDAGKGRRRRGQQRIRWLDSITDSTDMNLSKLETLEDREAWCAIVHGVAESKVTEQHQQSLWAPAELPVKWW